MSASERTAGLLSPYRVLDLTDELGLCGKILGDLGADVIKIERAGGDPARMLGPFFNNQPDPEKSLYWFGFNSNKRGVTAQSESAPGRELFPARSQSPISSSETFTQAISIVSISAMRR
jgi:crotonobetainyl-CoA:carnitine CoA-transferase CaiB-like acyl-CoA transferase